MLLLSCSLNLIALCLCALSSCSKPGPFSNETFQSYDGRTLKFISGDELELQDPGGNLVCKYTKTGDTIRFTQNLMGATVASYFTVIPTGLQQKDGPLFFTPSALAAKRAENLQQQRQFETLLAASRKETRVITVLRMEQRNGFAGSVPGEATVTDVSLRFTEEYEHSDKVNTQEFWFGDITRIHDNSDVQRITFSHGPDGMEQTIFTTDNSAGIKLKTALKEALSAWNAKYSEVRKLLRH